MTMTHIRPGLNQFLINTHYTDCGGQYREVGYCVFDSWVILGTAPRCEGLIDRVLPSEGETIDLGTEL